MSDKITEDGLTMADFMDEIEQSLRLPRGGELVIFHSGTRPYLPNRAVKSAESHRDPTTWTNQNRIVTEVSSHPRRWK